MKKCIFIWIPKVAGNSIKDSLNISKIMKAKRLRKFKNNGDITSSHFDINMLRKKGVISDEFWEKAFKFAFVRNPWDRIVSLCTYIRGNKRHKVFEPYQKDMDLKKMTQYLKNGIPPIGFYNARGLSQANQQINWIPDDIDFIGRYENLQSDFDKICDKLDIGRRKILHINKTNHKNYWEYYTDEIYDVVTKFYKDDIERFGYKFKE